MGKMLNVVLRPTEELVEAAVSLSARIAQDHETDFVLDGVTFHPHVTLYKISIADEDVLGVYARVQQVARRHRPISCPFGAFQDGRGYLYLRLKPEEALQLLHAELVRALNGVRIRGARIRSKGREAVMSSEERFNNLRYGHPNVLDTYRPHMSISRLRDPDEVGRVLKEISWPENWTEQVFRSSMLGVYLMGEHGTCRELVYTAPLRGEMP